MDETAHVMNETAHFMDENITFQSYGSKGQFMDETAKLMEKKNTSQAFTAVTVFQLHEFQFMSLNVTLLLQGKKDNCFKCF